VARVVTAIKKLFTRKAEGATAVEYAIMLAAIAAVIIVTVIALGPQVENAFNYVSAEMGTLAN
jgi:pilus assembly protein Flp/PilA